MKKSTLDAGGQEISFTPDFLHIPGIIAFDKELQNLDVLVYGVIFWMERLKDGRCFASNTTLAKVVGSSSSGVANALVRLRDKGYIICLYDDKNQRKEIKTLVFNTVNPYSNEEGGVTQMSNIGINTKKEITSDELTNIRKVYLMWLRLIVLTPSQRSIIDPELRKAALKEAMTRCHLTDNRKTKINTRIKSMGLETVLKAVVGISKSEWHRGDNDNGWTASLDWLCHNDEKIEEWANKYSEETEEREGSE